MNITMNGRPNGLPRNVRLWNEALRFCRQNKRLAQKDVASAVGASATEVDLWESGHGAPSSRVLTKLYDVLPLLSRFNHLVPRQAVRAATEVESARRHPPKPDPEPSTPHTLPEALAAMSEPEPKPAPPPKRGPMTFGEALRAARVLRGWDQKTAAERGGVTQSNLSRWERDGAMNRASHDLLMKLFPELAVDAPNASVARRGDRLAERAPRTAKPRAERGAAMLALPAVPRSEPLDKLGLELARAMAESQNAAQAYEAAMAAAVAAEERKKLAIQRADQLLRELKEAAGWKEGPTP